MGHGVSITLGRSYTYGGSIINIYPWFATYVIPVEAHTHWVLYPYML